MFTNKLPTSYSQFTLAKVKEKFKLTTNEKVDFFIEIPILEPSHLLKETLSYNLPLALASNSGKARSEMIISPILIELRKQLQDKINIFSGIEFNVESDNGLTGVCDFIISDSPEQLFISAPVVALVEAKKENINAGLGQCVAEMIAAKIFNERSKNEITAIYGTVTTGTNWRFLKLEGSIINIDLSEYYLRDIDKILGILAMGIRSKI
ncbi:hypothetical protein NIES267_61520 [Calothrix parasitica NIES-267]|uniref:Uncharacterized protein n=1 Tax=Calothrix parasitica NIES-267 TaxID=1973488 RepID=A0A1Z4LZN2_9CYAN|nr:hypothetical protein NIES267_61520 [Calothrix parasitica NIES-267]